LRRTVKILRVRSAALSIAVHRDARCGDDGNRVVRAKTHYATLAELASLEYDRFGPHGVANQLKAFLERLGLELFNLHGDALWFGIRR
jgi:hypothetical protein